MKLFRLLILIPLAFSLSACDTLRQIGEQIYEPTPSEMTAALRQALEVGTGNAVKHLNRENGFYQNPRVMIPFPPEAIRAANTLRDLGLGQIVDDFIMTMNRGAEQAAAEAGPIFVNAIRQMTIEDARDIVLGDDTAATHFFRKNTYNELYQSFYPHITQALEQVNATRYWTDIITQYNRIPTVQKIETDLGKYTTNMALDGLFKVVSDEEKLIRDDPAKRVTDLLRRVFGWASAQQNQPR